MKHRRGHHSDRLSKMLRESMESEFARETTDRVKSFVHEKPVLSACLGLAAGFMLGMLVRRKD